MAPDQVCQAICRQQGRRPSGKGRVKSAFQLPGKQGGGEGSAEKRNRPGLSVGDTKHGSQRGPDRGEGGCWGTAHPHTCAGAGGGMCTAHSSAGANRRQLSASGLGEGLQPRDSEGSRQAVAAGQ